MKQSSWQDDVKKSECPPQFGTCPHTGEEHLDDLQGEAVRPHSSRRHLKEDDEARDVFEVFLGIIPEGAHFPPLFLKPVGLGICIPWAGRLVIFLVFWATVFWWRRKTRCQKIPCISKNVDLHLTQ